MMKKNLRILPMTAALIACVSLAGCGERLSDKETEKQTERQTQVQTEAVTEIQIETQKQTETEKPTEKQTEPATEAVTEAPVVEENTPDLPVEEEQAAETELAAYETFYANDDLNVRETPTTEADNIIDSFDQGEEVTVIARTPHWYKVQIDDYTGYVHRDGLSETAVEPKSPEERSQAAPVSDIDIPEDSNVSRYAESFSVRLAIDANLRSSASEQSDVVDVLSAGSTLTALGESGDWYLVEYDGTVGYINRNLVE